MAVTPSAWPRPVVFLAVGVSGYVLQTVALWAMVGGLRMSVVPAALGATEIAILHNFAWHVRWTWADRPANRPDTLGRFFRFNLSNGGVSLAGGALLMPLLVSGLGVHYLAANLITVLTCSMVNYLAGDRFVFAPSLATRSRQGPVDA